jgi:hypothetical protein
MFAIENLQKSYFTSGAEVRAVDGISLAVETGKLVTLLGPLASRVAGILPNHLPTLLTEGGPTRYAAADRTSWNEAICGAVLKYADCNSAESANLVCARRRKITFVVSAG